MEWTGKYNGNKEDLVITRGMRHGMRWRKNKAYGMREPCFGKWYNRESRRRARQENRLVSKEDNHSSKQRGKRWRRERKLYKHLMFRSVCRPHGDMWILYWSVAITSLRLLIENKGDKFSRLCARKCVYMWVLVFYRNVTKEKLLH